MKKNIFLSKLVALLFDYFFMMFVGIALMFFISVLLAIFLGIMDGIKVSINESVIFRAEHILSVYSIIIFCFFYYGHAFKKTGQTIGERIIKIKIVPAYGERISLLTGILRTIFLAPLLALIGLIPVSRNPYKSLLDHICQTKTEKA